MVQRAHARRQPLLHLCRWHGMQRRIAAQAEWEGSGAAREADWFHISEHLLSISELSKIADTDSSQKEVGPGIRREHKCLQLATLRTEALRLILETRYK